MVKEFPQPLPGEPTCTGARAQEMRYQPTTGNHEAIFSCPLETCILKKLGDLPTMERGTVAPYDGTQTPLSGDEARPLLLKHAAKQTRHWRKGCVAAKIMSN